MAEETQMTKADQIVNLEEAFNVAQGITRDPRAAAMLLIANQIAGLEDGLMKLREVLGRLEQPN